MSGRYRPAAGTGETDEVVHTGREPPNRLRIPLENEFGVPVLHHSERNLKKNEEAKLRSEQKGALVVRPERVLPLRDSTRAGRGQGGTR